MRAVEVLCGRGLFGYERRLTGFRGARKIIRIRTKMTGANGAMFSTPADHGIRHRYPFGPDSLTLACELVHAD
jgi:hypothetical protein